MGNLVLHQFENINKIGNKNRFCWKMVNEINKHSLHFLFLGIKIHYVELNSKNLKHSLHLLTFKWSCVRVLGIIIHYDELDSKNLKHSLHLLAFQWSGLLLKSLLIEGVRVFLDIDVHTQKTYSLRFLPLFSLLL